MFMSNLEKATLFSFLRYKAVNKGIILRRCTEWSVHNFKGRFFGFLFLCMLLNSASSAAPQSPLSRRTLHEVEDRTQDYCDFGIASQTFYLTSSARSHPPLGYISFTKLQRLHKERILVEDVEATQVIFGH